jgi:tetratricopeptide (TPR) repeat protein
MPDQRDQLPAREAAAIYQRVIAKDPLFAPAYAGLAAAYAASSAQHPGHQEHAVEELTQMRSAAEKAVQLDPLLAEAHDALGMVYARDGHWGEAEDSFRLAIGIDPNDSAAYTDFAMWLLLPLGRVDEAIRYLRTAEKADPLSAAVQHALGLALIYTGRYEEAVGHCRRGILDAECLGRARLGQGKFDEAVTILRAGNPRYLGYAYGRAGRRAEAEEIAARVAPNPFSEALVFAGLGDKSHTLEALDRVAKLGGARIGRALNAPEFALLRSDPRADTLRAKVGLPR